jgi:uncharacterized protein (DUF1015 family)
MAKIKPFRGVRPIEDKVQLIASPPYDVLNSKEARILAENNNTTFLHVVKPEIDLPEDLSLYDEKVYQKGKENLTKFIDEGLLIQDKKDCYYIYKLKMGDVVENGIVAGASIEDYENDVIKKHEHTRADKEADRTKHVETLSAHTGPVFLTYKSRDDLKILVEKVEKNTKPVYDFTTEDGVSHTFWKIDDDATISEITKKFSDINLLYVADGHHRSASATKVGQRLRAENKNHTGNEEYNYFLSVIFPHDELYIMDYNRVVKDLNGLSKSEFLDKVAEKFQVEKYSNHQPYQPEQTHFFGMYLDKTWYKLEAKPESFDAEDAVKSLDVSILQENLLHPVLGIGDPRKDKRIDFVGGIRGLEELSNRVDAGEAVAFSMYPTSIEELMKIADQGKVMPPKSTWFEPKLRSGMIVHLF